MARRRFLPALRSGAVPADVETKSLADRVRSVARSYTVAGQAYENNWNLDRAIREGFEGNPWVFRAVEVICYTTLDRKIVLRKGDEKSGELVDPEADPTRLLFCLNRRANPWETARVFRYRMIAQFLLSSRGVFIEVTRSQAGRIAMLTLLDPDLVDIMPGPRTPIASFRIRPQADNASGDYDYLPPFDPENETATNSVLWLRSPHPTIPWQGMSPMQAAGLSVDLDRYARLYNRTYMQSNGRPDSILMVKGTVDRETLDVLEARFNSTSRPGKTTAIQGDAMAYQDLSSTPRDMQWSEAMDRMKKEAAMVFGVPESLMGDASGRTFDNADAEYASFWEGRIGPLLGLIDDQLDVLTGGFADDLWLRHDTSDVWVLSRHERADEDRAVADHNAGLLTIDDVREAKGLDRLEIPATQVLWIPPGRAAAAVGEDAEDTQKAAAELPVLGNPAPPGGGMDPGALAEQTQGIASYNAQTNATASRLRLVAGEAQGRPTGGGAFEQMSASTAEIEGKRAPELEGEQSGARDEGRSRPAPTWR